MRRNYDEPEKVSVRTIFLVLSVFVAVVFPIGVLIYGVTGPEYTYQYAVRSHMENAYFSDTPELIVEELVAAKAGMVSLGLEDSDYGAYWSWGKTPDESMKYQYKHIDAIIQRAQDVIEWRDETNGTSAETKDIYEEKVANIRKFIKDEGWSDDIARRAYMYKYYPFYSVFAALIEISLMVVVANAVRLKLKESYE